MLYLFERFLIYLLLTLIINVLQSDGVSELCLYMIFFFLSNSKQDLRKKGHRKAPKPPDASLKPGRNEEQGKQPSGNTRTYTLNSYATKS